MKIATSLTAATLLATTQSFAPINTRPSLTSLQGYTLPQENGLWAPHTAHPDTRHKILPQELGVWSTSPPPGYTPPHTNHIDTRKKILDQESKGVWPTTPPPGWVCEYLDVSCIDFYDVNLILMSFLRTHTSNYRSSSRRMLRRRHSRSMGILRTLFPRG
jgi:hypothetical protein